MKPSWIEEKLVNCLSALLFIVIFIAFESAVA